MLRRGLAALAAATTLALAGCAGSGSTVIDHSLVTVGVDVPYAGVGGASPAATVVDLAVAAATLGGFSFEDAGGRSVPDPSFGSVTVVSQDPFIVRYTVADGLAWSDGVGVDGVDLLLDWAARAHPIAGVAFGSIADPALAGSRSARLSSDRKSLDIEFASSDTDWADAFRAPLPAHAIAARAFDAPSPEAAKDAVIEAVELALHGDVADLRELAHAWATTFSTDGPLPPASGPYALVSAAADRVELAVNARYSGLRNPTYAGIELVRLSGPAAAVQGLAIGELDVIQVAWSDELSPVLGRLTADWAVVPAPGRTLAMAAWFHRDVDHVEPAQRALGALWNPWAWAPYTPPEL